MLELKEIKRSNVLTVYILLVLSERERESNAFVLPSEFENVVNIDNLISLLSVNGTTTD